MGATDIVRVGGAVDVAPTSAAAISIVSGGPAGPQGADGVAAAFEFEQSSPAAEWIVNHNLGAEPLVTVLSVGGAEMEAQVLHFSANQFRVYFASPQAGRARCL